MNSQSALDLTRLASGQTLRLGAQGGELTVVQGRIWLTRDGDLDDHVVEPGQTLSIGADQSSVIEPAPSGANATVRWRPRGAGLFERLGQLGRLCDMAPGQTPWRTRWRTLLHNR